MTYMMMTEENTFKQVKKSLEDKGYVESTPKNPRFGKIFAVAYGDKINEPDEYLAKNWDKSQRPRDLETGELLKLNVEILTGEHLDESLYSEFHNERTGERCYYVPDGNKSVEYQIEADREEVEKKLGLGHDEYPVINEQKNRSQTVDRDGMDIEL